MNIKVKDLMVEKVVTASPDDNTLELKRIMNERRIHAIPVVEDGEPVGMITSTDLLRKGNENRRVGFAMTTKVYTVPEYSDISVAARGMRNHHIHHVVVTHEKSVIGVLSSFDLLRLVEDHRFQMKNPSTPSKKAAKRA